MMPVRCAWCGADLGEKPGEGVTGVSHGICDLCLKRETKTVLEAVQVLKEIASRKGEV